MNTIEKLNSEMVAKLTATTKVPDFKPGDTLRVNVKVVEASASACSPSRGCASRARTPA
jgi:large subunit ribosomal protein L19